MELHIWGPAFGLPSIDAECLAAVVYLHSTLPPEQWILVLSQEASISPSGELPCLINDDTIIAGFPSIVDLSASSDFPRNLDARLTKRELADALALKAHLATHALPLLSHALYTSTNYHSDTRPAWHKIFGSHSSFAPSPCADRYSIAQKHTASLGLSDTTLDDASSDSTAGFTPQQQQEARMISSTPSLLFRKRQTVQAVLREQQSQTRFRLDSLVDALVGPIDATLGGGEHLLSDADGLTSIDCLAFGYLALLLYPELSNNIISETIRKRYPRVVRYVDRLRKDFWGDAKFDPEEVLRAPLITSRDSSVTVADLPYRATAPMGMTDSLKKSSTMLLSRLLRPITQQPQHLDTTSGPLINAPSPLLLQSWLHPNSLLMSIAGPLLAGTAWFIYRTTHINQETRKYFGRPQPKIKSMGAAGDLLADFGL